MRFYTIGYGGRIPADLVTLLKERGVQTLVDVRLRPDRASMGAYVRASTPDKGIERLLGAAGVRYVSLPELGNMFMDSDDWQERYARLLERSFDLLAERLLMIDPPFCLMCAEKRAEQCHRRIIAEHLVRRGWEVEHIE